MSSRRAMLNDIWRDSQKLRYLAVGAWNTVFAYLAFGFIYLELHDRLHYLLISVLAHLLAVINAFICQRWLVFQSQTFWLTAFLRFNMVQLLALGWGLAGLAFLVEVLHLNPLPSQLLTMAVAIIVSYVLHRDYSFRI
jgi:putative flippase GtrA